MQPTDKNLQADSQSTMSSWFKDKLVEWRGVVVCLLGVLGVVGLSVIIAFLVLRPTENTVGKVLALSVAIALIFFALVLIFSFFFVFRGADATNERFEYVIIYCYAFIVFALTASILPFVVLSDVPSALEIMRKAPIGIVKGCSATPKSSDKNQIPYELRCGANTDQWVVNIGGIIDEPAGPQANLRTLTCTIENSSGDTVQCIQPRTVEAYRTALKSDGTMQTPTNGRAASLQDAAVSITGGLVVPLYVVVLALMGASVSMTRRVPEFQRRTTHGDPEYMSLGVAREAMVFQIMQVASAPLIAITSYYIIEPNSRASTIVLAFASGFSSETVLLFIRAVLDKVRPNTPSPSWTKSNHVSVVPGELDFGDVIVNDTSTKSVAIRNPAPIDLVVASASCTGEFVSALAMPQTIPAGSSINVSVNFKPVSEGFKSGVLTITDNALGSPRTITLSGNGIKSAALPAITPTIPDSGQTTAAPAANSPLPQTDAQSGSDNSASGFDSFGQQHPQNEND